jgi:hypothetical protein
MADEQSAKADERAEKDHEAEVSYNQTMAENEAAAKAKENAHKATEELFVKSNKVPKTNEFKETTSEHERQKLIMEAHEKAMQQWLDEKAQAEAEFAAAALAHMQEHTDKLGALQDDITAKQAIYDNTVEEFDNATSAYNVQVGLVEVARTKPANIAPSSDDFPANQAFFKLRADSNFEQRFLLKFKQELLMEKDSVMEGWLHLTKETGFPGPATVKAVSCAWTKNGATYTNTMNYDGPQCSLEGSVPDGDDQRFNISLRGDVINSNRVQGDHICLEVSGGPTGSEDVISSIAAANAAAKPQLQLKVKFPKPNLNETAPESPGENPGGETLDESIQKVKDEKRAELTKVVKAQQLKQKKVWFPEATALNMGDMVRVEAIVEEKLTLAMAEYRAKIDGFTPGGEEMLGSSSEDSNPEMANLEAYDGHVQQLNADTDKLGEVI